MAMTRVGRAARARDWPILTARRLTVSYVVFIDLIALAWSLKTLASFKSTGHEWGISVLLLLLALAFEERARRAARLRLRMSSELKRDMTSVWCVAAALAVGPAYAVILLVPLMTYVWFRQQRPAGEIFYRKLFNVATVLISCFMAGIALRALHHVWGHLPLALSGCVTVLLAIFVYGLVNRVLVTLGVMSLGNHLKDLLGTPDDNLIELATLCLGGLLAVGISREPWVALLVIAPMVTLQRGALVRELETAATIDSKTGLLNAIAWEQLAQREIARAVRDSQVLSVLLLDIDHFKRVNDRFGHLAGDSVLRGLARTLGSSIREYDTAGRFGGEEFVAVLPNADIEAAAVIAERVRAQINRHVVSDLAEGVDVSDPMRLSVSVGVACLHVHGDELADLLHSADRALYRAKSAGRNQIACADRGEEPREELALG